MDNKEEKKQSFKVLFARWVLRKYTQHKDTYDLFNTFNRKSDSHFGEDTFRYAHKQFSEWKKVTLSSKTGKFYLFKAKNNMHPKRLVYMIHGGAFVGGLLRMWRVYVKHLQEVFQCDVAAIDYTLGQYPTPFVDICEGYEILTQDYDDIVVQGDSAGGFFAVALTCKMINENKKLPSKVVLFSPYIDMNNLGESHKFNQEKDVLLGNLDFERCKEVYAGFVEDKYTSKLLDNNFDLFPPLSVHVGGDEVLLDDSKMIAAKCKKSEIFIYPGAFHDFPVWPSKEAKLCWDRLKEFEKK